MEWLLIITLIIVLAGFGLVIFFLNKNTKEPKDDKSLLLLQNQIDQITRTLDSRLSESTKAIQSHFGQSAKIITDVTEKLTKLDETNKQVLNFSDQLQSLQDILKNQKQRGILGEYYLETLLKNILPPASYQMQYKFRDGVIVDAVIFFGDKIIPIDSKFSLENYNRIVEEQDVSEREKLEKLFKQDLKNRIDETSKYIRPGEKTTPFAFMFIPAEGIYYDLLVNKVGSIKVNTRDLLEYAARDKKVHIVSPTTFYVTMQAMKVGMEAYKIQESTEQIIKDISVLGNHLRAYEQYFERLGNNLGTTVNAYNLASKELAKIDKDVVKISGGERSIEPTLIDKPQS